MENKTNAKLSKINQVEQNDETKALVFVINKVKKVNNWTKEEDKILLKIAGKYNYKNWKAVAHHLIGRSDVQCSARYKRIKPGIIKGVWTVDEDILLLNLIKRFGKNWSLISKYMSSRSGKQIRDRYLNTLDPELNKEKFTEEEDQMIIRYYSMYGTLWSKIAKYFKGRTGDMIKNRFYSSLRKRGSIKGRIEESSNHFDSVYGSGEINMLQKVEGSINNSNEENEDYEEEDEEEFDEKSKEALQTDSYNNNFHSSMNKNILDNDVPAFRSKIKEDKFDNKPLSRNIRRQANESIQVIPEIVEVKTLTPPNFGLDLLSESNNHSTAFVKHYPNSNGLGLPLAGSNNNGNNFTVDDQINNLVDNLSLQRYSSYFGKEDLENQLCLLNQLLNFTHHKLNNFKNNKTAEAELDDKTELKVIRPISLYNSASYVQGSEGYSNFGVYEQYEGSLGHSKDSPGKFSNMLRKKRSNNK